MKSKFILSTLFLFLLISSCTSTQKKTIKPPESWPTTNKEESESKVYYEQNAKQLDLIEGIWTCSETISWVNVISGIRGKNENGSKYRIAILKDKNNDEKFNAYILESRQKEWTKGRLKAKYRKTAYSTAYEQIWYTGNYSELVSNVVIVNKGMIKDNLSFADYPINYESESILLKVYPLLNSTPTKISNEAKSSSSGFLISEKGLVITNYHAVENSNSIEILFPNFKKKYFATIRLKDAKNDIAILELKDFSYSTNFS